MVTPWLRHATPLSAAWGADNGPIALAVEERRRQAKPCGGRRQCGIYITSFFLYNFDSSRPPPSDRPENPKRPRMRYYGGVMV